MVGGASVHTSKHSLFRLKFTVGCPPCTYPSIHVETLRITVDCLWSTYPSIRNKNLHSCWTPWPAPQKKKGAVGTSTRADGCAFTGDPQPRLFEFTPLSHSGHCAEITLCQHFLRASSRKQKGDLLVTVWEPGQDIQNKDTRNNGHVRQQSDDVISMASPGRHQAQSDAALQVGHRACGSRSWRHVNHLRLRRRVWHGRGVLVV